MASEPMTTEELEDATRYVEYGETKFGEGWAEERNIPLLRRLLDENARLNAENERLSTLRDALVMKLGGVLTVVPQLRRVFGDSPVQIDTVAHLLNQALPAAPEMPRPPATMDDPEVSTAGGSTGVPEPEKGAQAVELVPGVWISSGRQNGKTAKTIAAAVAAAKPGHYREAAASLRAIATANRDVQSEAYINGIESAAGRLDSVARDLDDAAPSLPVPSTEKGPADER